MSKAGNLKRNRSASILTFIALALASVAFVLLIFLPTYTGGYTDPITGKTINSSATLIQVNGYGVLLPLVVPVLFAGLGLLAVLMIHRGVRGGRLVLWVVAALLAIFDLVTGFSIGAFYVPAAVLLLTSAALTGRNADTTSAR